MADILPSPPDEDAAAFADSVRQADAEIDAGQYITHERMRAWLLSWGTEHELPPPECE